MDVSSMRVSTLLFFLLVIFSAAYPAGKRSQALTKENYPFSPYSPLIARIKTAPDFVMDHLNHTIYLKGNCTPYLPETADFRSFERSFGYLPPILWKAMREKVLGIYFVSNMWSSGITESVYDRQGREFYIIFFNTRVLGQDLSEILTSKLNTAFIRDKGPTNITVDCGTDLKGSPSMSVMPGFLYILLHEAAHVAEFSGYLKTGPYRKAFTEFTNGIWRSYDRMDKRVEPSFRKDITFYGNKKGPKLTRARAGSVFTELTNSPFVSPYAYLNENDDLAEFLSFYYLTQRLLLPYRILIRDGTNPTGVYKPMESEKVRARFPAVRTLLSENPN